MGPGAASLGGRALVGRAGGALPSPQPSAGPWRPGLTCPQAREPPAAAQGPSPRPAAREGADARRGGPRGGLGGAAREWWAPGLLQRRGHPQNSRAPGLPQRGA